MESITLDTARKLALYSQGIFRTPTQKAGPEQIRSVIAQLGALQIDTIHVVARSPYFVLWSRLGDYDPSGLDRLLEQGRIFEYWAHAACFLPMEDYALHRRLMIEKKRQLWFTGWYDDHQQECEAVLDYVRQNGPVRSADFERKDDRKSGWWDWKSEKRSLEYWFAAGELMVSKRVNFQRVYDLRERVMPDWRDTDAPDLDTVYRSLALRSIAAMGVSQPGWVADYFRLPKVETLSVMDRLIREKRLVELQVEGWKESGWALPEVWEDFNSFLRKTNTPGRSTLLSPFDSLIWDRKRTSQLFQFDYTIECYLPTEKRKYGYFSLPILLQDRLIGRLDAKAHRAEKIFEIKAIFLEDGIDADSQMIEEISASLQSCAAWHGAEKIRFHEVLSNDANTVLQSIYNGRNCIE